jgi:hypothetical protein
MSLDRTPLSANGSRRRVLAVRRFGPEPSLKTQEGMARITLYPARRRRVTSEPQRSSRAASTAGSVTAGRACDDIQHD